MKKFCALLVLLTYSVYSIACSTFLLSKNGQHVFGRNYDWVSGNGAVMVNARGVQKSAFVGAGEKAINWVSDCGSITFNQYGKEFPHGGMNEKGLVVELMWLSETAYPAADKRAALNELQWIQYQLDNCTTVEEVIATDAIIRINRQGAAPLHYLVADARGGAATIEFIGGKMVVHKGADLAHPVLTNTIYKDALQQVAKSGNKQSGYGDNSVDRFATACNLVQGFQQVSADVQPVEYAFNILNKVAQGDFTKWRIVYDITGRNIHFVTNNQQARKQFSFSDFDFSCQQAPLHFNLDNAQNGSIAAYFTPLTFDANKNIMERSAVESRSHVQVTTATISAAAAYFKSVSCK